MRDIASKLLKLKLSVVPINRETKIPAVDWKEYQTRFMTEQELDIFNDLTLDIGIITGPISGIFVLDIDEQHPEAIQFMSGKKIPRTWTEKTKNGYHYYFRYTPELASKKTLTRAILAPGVDSRGDKGLVKCAPSANYKWIVSPFGNPLANPPQWLVDLLPNKETPLPVTTTSDEPWIIQSLNSIVDRDPVRGRTPTFIRVIGSLKKKGLSAKEVEGFLKPWAEKHEYVGKLIKLVDDQYKRYPSPPSTISNEDTGSIVEFMKDIKPVEWIVPGMIAKASINIVGGLGESRKTWLVNDLAIQASIGGMWLGRFPVTREKVLMINQERPKAEVQRRFVALLAGAGIDHKSLENQLLIRSGTTTRINLQQSFDAFHKYLDEQRPSLVLIDSFNTFHTLTEESRADMQFVFEKVKQLRDTFGCAFVFIDHESKAAFQNNQQGDNAEVMLTHDKLAGSAVKSEAAEGIFIVRLSDKESSMVYHTKNTLGTKIDPFLVKVTDLNEQKSKIRVAAF